MKPKLFELELFISKILRVGVLVAGFLLFIGWMMDIQFTENPLAKFQDYRPQTLFSSLEVLYQTGQWGGFIAYGGLMVLISLPMIRVLMTALLFWKQKEFIMAGLASFVLVALLVSFSLGLEL